MRAAVAVSAAPGATSPDDVVVLAALRTPITRARSGGFKSTGPEELLSAVLRAVVGKVGLRPEAVEDIRVGNVLPPGGGATVARMAALHAGFPETTSIATVNRQCSSGLQAVADIAAAIRAGIIDVGIGAGVESMTAHYGPGAMPSSIADCVSAVPAAADCMIPMGVTSENVAEKHKVPRSRQDAFAVASHQKAAAAAQNGLFADEIVPVNGVSADDGVRPKTTTEALARLRPAFRENGCTTAGNSSQVSDGAAAVLLCRRSCLEKLKAKFGLPASVRPLARFVSFAVAGVPPSLMGIGPAKAIPRALALAGVRPEQVDILELNEAFASQALACLDLLRAFPESKVNPKGGAIALGHPLGATGARQIATLLPELKRTNGRIGVVSMCIGTGMGAAAVIVRED